MVSYYCTSNRIGSLGGDVLAQESQDLRDGRAIENSRSNSRDQGARDGGGVSFAVEGGFVGIDPEPVVGVVGVAIANNGRVGSAIFVLGKLVEGAGGRAKTHFL
jgi:hypothetical protein